MEELVNIVHYRPSPSVAREYDKKSVLGWNVCYVVCGLVIDEGKVLMVQEAKLSCREKWYLPAGRVEPNESLEDAVKREVKEEAGVEFEPQALILIESQSYNWIRFTYTGRIVGGELKTLAQADKESLQAKWLPVNEEEMIRQFPIRARDCLSVIKHASDWYQARVHYTQLTIPSGHQASWIRIVLIHDNKHVLMRNKGTAPYLPCGPFNKTIRNCVDSILKESGYISPQYTVIGALTIEHLVSVGDGVGITLLVRGGESTLKDGCGFNWTIIKDEYVLENINLCLENGYKTINVSIY